MLHSYLLHPLTGVGLAPMLGFFSIQAQTAPPAFAATSQFHGANWAGPDDNCIPGPNIPVGLSESDSYSATHAKATTILKGFQSFGANTVRFGINPGQGQRYRCQPGSGHCLDAYNNGTAAGTKVDIWPRHGQSNQQWTLG
jgi:hypothetical protein